MSTKVAVIPKPPVLLDRTKTIETALESIDEAAGEGASLLGNLVLACIPSEPADHLSKKHFTPIKPPGPKTGQVI